MLPTKIWRGWQIYPSYTYNNAVDGGGMGNSSSIPATKSSLDYTPVQENQLEEPTMMNNERPQDVVANENDKNGVSSLKELVIVSGGVSGFVEVSSNDTLSQVRSLVMEDFDDDMIPDEGDFYFAQNGIRLSAKQEARKRAWDLLDANAAISIHSKRKKQKVQEEEILEEQVETTVDVREEKEKNPNGEESAANNDAMKNDNAMDIDTTESDPAAGESGEKAEPKAHMTDTVSTEGGGSVQNKNPEEAPETETQSATEKSSNAIIADATENGTDTLVSATGSSSTSSTASGNCIAGASEHGSNVETSSVAKGPFEAFETTPAIAAIANGNDSLLASTESTVTTSSPLSRRSLNFNAQFPYDRHEEQDEEAEAMKVDEPTLTAATLESEPPTKDPEANSGTTVQDDSQESTGKDGQASATSANQGSNKAADKQDKTSDDVVMVAETQQQDKTVDNVVMVAEQDDDDDDEDDDDIEHVVPAEDPHKIHDEALKNSCDVLTDIKNLLNDNPLFCSEDRRKDWTAEISESLTKSAPNVVIGVLGNTGVGKSSLLNAILEEASVLPTSGSRGCTAAVVELRFNKALKDATTEVPVYKGEVEFITLQEWAVELKILIDECSTAEEKTIYARRPEEERQPDAAAAWAKIDQVYGRGTMERFTTWRATAVYDRLVNDTRVKKLLTPQQGINKPHNAILIEEGEVNPEQAAMLLKGFSKIGTRLRRTKKKWAQKFRSKINDYVYRKGNGNLPQTWPLIRKVVLEGPWVALNSGACLVDLPGVRDANAARAKVSESYLMNCSQIWVVAPIKRAVDDGTAKELLGEQFKRRLLMDGQYGNVSFICTQTDDCEATEIMRDHQDVAVLKPGRWERMTELRDKIMAIEKDFADLVQEEEDLKIDYEEADMSAKDAKEELEEEQKESMDIDDDGGEDAGIDVERLALLQKTVDEKSEASKQALVLLHAWQAEHKEQMERMQDIIRKLQRRLKAICATVRNEYSTTCLQEDFRAGLKELCRKPDEEEADGLQQDSTTTNTPLPDDFNMDVYCISANDYLKIEGIKPSSDGPPSTFSKASDTQIPSLRSFVHTTTAKFRENFTTSFVNSTSDMVDRVKLLAADASNVPGGRTSRRCQSLFESEMAKVAAKIKPIAQDFRRKSETRINSSLTPALKTGAAKGQSVAMSTVQSWGSHNRRSKNDKRPDKNGLYYSTYLATVRRDGAYVSKSAGPVDFNQELCDPMEKEFGSDWQRVLDSSIKVFLRESETKVLALASAVDKAVVSGLAQTGLDSARLAPMATTASRTCSTALKASFRAMNQVATNTQRELNRSLLPKVQARMKQGYSNTTTVQGGNGKFMRMKTALEGHSRHAVQGMFDESTTELLKAVQEMVTQLANMIAATADIISKTMEGVYSVCWDDQSDKAALMDPAMQQKVRECRDKLLPDLNKLRQIQDETMRLVGIEREELDLDVMGVESWESQNAEKLQKAIDAGELIDLCDSDEEAIAENLARMPPPPAAASSLAMRIKPDPGAVAAAGPGTTSTVTPSFSSGKASSSGGSSRFV